MELDKKDLEQLAENLLEHAFANSMAYTRTVKAEDRFERLERIEKALALVDQKANIAYQELLTNPHPLD